MRGEKDLYIRRPLVRRVRPPMLYSLPLPTLPMDPPNRIRNIAKTMEFLLRSSTTLRFTRTLKGCPPRFDASSNFPRACRGNSQRAQNVAKLPLVQHEEISKVVWMWLKSVFLVFCRGNGEMDWMRLVLSSSRKQATLDLARADVASQHSKRVTHT